MNDLPQNELLSAYLDGELTAAEQAQVERLLAASPAARQLLDELRAVSTALQSLPQQKLGEDLSGHVLRIAERRMLTEGEPGNDSSEFPSPQGIRRFVNRRTIVWTGLAAAVALLIAFNEHREQGVLADKGKKDVAVAHHDRDEMKPASELAAIPTIEAASEAIAEGAKREARRAGGQRRGGEPRRVGEFAGSSPAKETLRDQAGTGDSYRFAAPGGQGGGFGGFQAPAKGSAPLTTPPLAPKSAVGQFVPAPGKDKAAMEKPGQSERYWADGTASLGSDVTVVFCNIDPEAAKTKELDKLLAANGVVSYGASTAKGGERMNGQESSDRVKADAVNGLSRQLHIEGVLKQRFVTDVAELVLVEATPAQLKATLVGLAAQPKVFRSVAVKSAQEEATRQAVRSYFKRYEETQNKAGDDFSFFNDAGWGENQQPRMPGLGMPKPAEVVMKKMPAKPAADNKSDLATAAHGEKAGGGAGQERDKSQKEASANGRKASASQPSTDEPSIARGSAAPAVPGGMPLSASSSPAPGMAPARQAGSAEAAAPAEQDAQMEQKGQGQPAPARSLAHVAPRQRVLFVLRIGDSPLHAGFQAAEQSHPAAKKSPTPAPAANPSPPK
jgi:hypothetical protein